jgi:hypothetical protein
MNQIVKLAEIERIAEMLAPFCDGDEQLFHDMMQGESSVDYVASRIWEQVARDAEILAGIKERKARLAERQDRLERRAEAGKAAIGEVLRRAKLKKLELPEVTLSVRDGKPKLEIADKDAVPSAFQRATYAPDKTAINEAFDDSDALPNWLTRVPAKAVVTARTK